MKCSPDPVEICVPGRCLECQCADGGGQAAPSASATLPKLLEEPRTPQVLLLPWVLGVHVLCLLFSQRNHPGSWSSNCGLAVACSRYSLWNKEVWNNAVAVCPWLGQWLGLADVLGEAHVDVLPLLYWEKLMLLTGVISLYPKPRGGEGAETQLPFSQWLVAFA